MDTRLPNGYQSVSTQKITNKRDKKRKRSKIVLEELISSIKTFKGSLNYGFVELCKHVCFEALDSKNLQTCDGLSMPGKIFNHILNYYICII